MGILQEQYPGVYFHITNNIASEDVLYANFYYIQSFVH